MQSTPDYKIKIQHNENLFVIGQREYFVLVYLLTVHAWYWLVQGTQISGRARTARLCQGNGKISEGEQITRQIKLKIYKPWNSRDLSFTVYSIEKRCVPKSWRFPAIETLRNVKVNHSLRVCCVDTTNSGITPTWWVIFFSKSILILLKHKSHICINCFQQLKFKKKKLMLPIAVAKSLITFMWMNSCTLFEKRKQ